MCQIKKTLKVKKNIKFVKLSNNFSVKADKKTKIWVLDNFFFKLKN